MIATREQLEQYVESLCQNGGLYYVHNRMGMATSTPKGVPDFIVAFKNGVTLWLVLAPEDGMMSPDKLAAQEWLRMDDHLHFVVSNNAEADLVFNYVVHLSDTH